MPATWSTVGAHGLQQTPPLLTLEASCYGLSMVSALTVMLRMTAPLYGTVMGLPGCSLVATPSALTGSSQTLQLPYLWFTMPNFKRRI